MLKRTISIIVLASLFTTTAPVCAQEYHIPEGPAGEMVRPLLDSIGEYLFTNPEISVRNSRRLYRIADSLNLYDLKLIGLQLAGEAYRELGDFPGSLDMQFRALRLNRQVNDKLGEAYSSSFLGYTLLQLEEYRSALTVLIPAARVLQSKDTIHYSFTLSNIASCFTQLDILDSAREFSKLSILEFQKIDKRQDLDLRRKALRQLILVRMGEMYEKMDLADSANIIYRQVLSYSMADSLFSLGGNANVKLAEYFLKKKNLDSAEYFGRAVLGDKQLKNVFNAAKLLLKVKEMRGQRDSALYFSRLSLALNDSLYGAQKFHQLQLIMFTEQQRRVDEEAQLMALEARKKTLLANQKIYALLAGILVLTIVGITLYRNNRARRKTNHLLHIKNKELDEQARNAQIEAALERIRSRSMGMQKSTELRELVLVIFQQMQGLGFNLNICNILLVDEKTNEVDYWLSFNGEGVLQKNYHIPYFDHPAYHYQLNAWRKARLFEAFELSGDSKRIWEDFLYTTDLKQISASVWDMMRSMDKIILSSVATKNGLLQTVTSEPLAEDSIVILQRFAKVFDQTYTRFLDLQKSEERAQAAILEASLERVRAETASMRHAADLERIIPMIWKELSILDVPFIRCGVFIVDDSQQLIHTFLSTPDGKAIGSFHLPFDVSNDMMNIVEHWKKKTIYRQHWDKAAFLEWTNNLVSRGFLEKPDNYSTESAPENLYLHFFPFTQGMLYVGNTNALPEKDIQRAQNLADAFSTAYARYDDFVKLERAKEQVDTALTELKQAQSQLIQAEKMASLGELTAGIAHEIQNPLNFVNNFSEVNNELLIEMKKEIDAGNFPEVKHIADDLESNMCKITEHGRRADSIVKSMLQHSRTSSNQKEKTDINTLVDEYQRLAYHGMRAKDKSFNANIVTHYDPDAGNPEIISQDLGRVLLNLLNNAFYAVNEKRKSNANGYEPIVSLETRRLGDKLEISVFDNGDGIPQQLRDKIFQPFFTTKPTGQGTGLGLSLSYDIVKAHGGNLTVESKQKEFTRFTVRLPIN